ncbi:MAG TPA: cell division protein ZipA [Gammaproteobacteria bacterium]|nr:cell division protein ZipA [Gammaproteobacteria bacterium]
MDVYIGLGLLSAGIVVVFFVVFDAWLKKRKMMPDRSGWRKRTKDDPEFGMNENLNGLSGRILDNVTLPEATYEMSRGVESSELADLCNSHTDADTSKKNERPLNASDNEPVNAFASSEPVVNEKRVPHPKTIAKKNAVLSSTEENTPSLPPNLLVLSVMARRDTRFESYDLLQAISAAGLQFGEMNIFHYYQATAVGKIALFSLASANKPGDFDLNNIAEFSCSGLMLFMDIAQAPDPQSAFKLMLDTAERLADDLDAVLCADPLTPWGEKLSWQYHQKIMHFKTASRHDNKTPV